MSALEYKIDWEDAPGVRERSLGATWARFELTVDGVHVTQVQDQQTKTPRNGIYGSLLPLAEWLVQNWWFIFSEAQQFETLRPSIKDARDPSRRGWLGRHNLLTAHAGGGFPDLCLSRSGDFVDVQWTWDDLIRGDAAVRFLTSGRSFLPSDEIGAQFANLINAVVERLRDKGCPLDSDFKTNWDHITGASDVERRFCSRAARLGIDAYCIEEISPELEKLLREGFAGWPDQVVADFLDDKPANPSALACDVDSVLKRLHGLHGQRVDRVGLLNGHDRAWLPHEMGYDVARQVRKDVFRQDATSPFMDFRATVADCLSWPSGQQAVKADLPQGYAGGVLGFSDDGGLHLLSGIDRFEPCNFLIARGIFHFLEGHIESGNPMLLTGAHVYRQQAGRAFAAELLAPASALRNAIRGNVVGSAEVGRLADVFHVSPKVIHHQLVNHDICEVQPFAE